MPTISILMATCGRPTLSRALASVLPQLAEGDEVLVIGDGCQPSAEQCVLRLEHPQVNYHEHGPTGFFGNAQKNFGAQLAHGDMLAFLDDDDLYEPKALDIIRRAAAKSPGRPLMFKIRCLEPAWIKWRQPVFANHNISGGTFVVPNVKDRLGFWPGPEHPLGRWGDRVFIEETLLHWPGQFESLVWRQEFIYRVPRASNNAP